MIFIYKFLLSIQFIYNAVYREVCIEFNHSQLNYYTELDAVSLGGILQYPENGGLELVSIPFMTHTTARYMYNGIELDDHELFSDIKTPDVIYFHLVFCYDHILYVIIWYEFLLDTNVNEFRSVL